MSIFIIDDDPLTVELLENILRQAGYRHVHSSLDPQTGYARIAELKPDLLILDLLMPGISGLDLCRRLKNKPETRDIPVMMITAESGRIDDTINLAYEAGCFDFITKPLRAAEVLSRIKSALTIRRALVKLQDELRLRTEMERVLQASEHRFRAVADLTPDAIVIADSSENIVYWNRGAEHMFGYASGEALGRPLAILLAERFRDADKRAFNAIARTDIESPFWKNVEAWGVRKTGEEFPMEASVASWQEGDAVFFSAAIRDLSDRARAEEQRIAQEKLNSVLEMAGAVCHELNQPLQVITGYAEMLEKQLPAGSKELERVKKIAAQAAKLGDMTKKLSAITRYETKSYIQKMRIVDIHKASETQPPEKKEDTHA